MNRIVEFSQQGAELYVPDGSDPLSALARTSHLGIGAHADDLELCAAHGILECHGRSDRWFSGVVVSDGRGSTRSGPYANVTDDQLVAVRAREQRQAAQLGGYSAQIQLFHSSAAVKAPADADLARDLDQVLMLSAPEFVYTHCLTDQHDTHVALSLRVLAAVARLPLAARPKRVLGCEVWRDLDWLLESDKVRLPVELSELEGALIRVFDSQLASGKRYDLAALGRRRAHATFADSRAADRHAGVILAMDLTPFIDAPDPSELVRQQIRRFESDVLERLARLC